MNNFDTLMKEIIQCNHCENKFGHTPHPVVFGSSKAKIFQLSQAPSATVHETMKPFTDKSGDRLKYDWYQISDEEFYNPNNFYLSALAHCYPGKNKGGGDKLPPKICFDKWIKKEVKLVNNKLYILIGAKAAKRFFPQENYYDLIFKDNYIDGVLTYVLPHPSPVNIKWFKDPPEFESERLIHIKNKIHELIR